MPWLYYKCNNCGYEGRINPPNAGEPPTLTCINCTSKMTYSKEIENTWINEVDKSGKRIRMEFKGSDERDCVWKACNYFNCEKSEIDYYVLQQKGLFSPYIIRAWKPQYNIDSNAIKITLDESNVNRWIVTAKSCADR